MKKLKTVFEIVALSVSSTFSVIVVSFCAQHLARHNIASLLPNPRIKKKLNLCR